MPLHNYPKSNQIVKAAPPCFTDFNKKNLMLFLIFGPKNQNSEGLKLSRCCAVKTSPPASMHYMHSLNIKRYGERIIIWALQSHNNYYNNGNVYCTNFLCHRCKTRPSMLLNVQTLSKLVLKVYLLEWLSTEERHSDRQAP